MTLETLLPSPLSCKIIIIMFSSQGCCALKNEIINVKGSAQSKHSISGNYFWTVHQRGRCYEQVPLLYPLLYPCSTCQSTFQLVAPFVGSCISLPECFLWPPNLLCCPTADWRSWGMNNSGGSVQVRLDWSIHTPDLLMFDWNTSESHASPWLCNSPVGLSFSNPQGWLSG